MIFKLIVGDKRVQFDEIGKIELVFYKTETSSLSHARLFTVPKVTNEISAVVSLEHMTENTPDLDPLICATFRCDGSELRGIRFQVPVEYFHSFKNPSKKRGFLKKVDCVDDLFIYNSRNILVLRHALLTGAERVGNETVNLTFKFEHYETFPIELLEKVIGTAYKKEET
jgi:hypothetical protein